MNVWMHKQTGDLVLAHPQWEPIEINFDESFFNDLMPEFKSQLNGRKIAKGTLCQVGWLLQNQHDMWLGIPLSAEKHFEDLGKIDD